MKNKKMLFKFGMMAFVMCWFLISFVSATTFTFDVERINALSTAISRSIIPVHFADNWNNFGWFIYFSNWDLWDSYAEEFCEYNEWEVIDSVEGGKCKKWMNECSLSAILGDISEMTCPFISISYEQWLCEIENHGTLADEVENYVWLRGESVEKTIKVCNFWEEWAQQSCPIENLERWVCWTLDAAEIYPVWTNGATAFECHKQMEWFYYNAQRWERLRPLDKETWSGLQGNLSIDWWIYTLCRPAGYREALEDCFNKYWQEEDNVWVTNPDLGWEEWWNSSEQGDEEGDYDTCVADADREYAYNSSYYGQVKHEYKWQTFGFIVGTNYKTDNSSPWIFPTIQDGLADTFVRFQNKIPVGFVYDYNWGVGFAWCEISSSNSDNSRTDMLKWLIGNWNPKELFKPNWTGGIKYVWHKVQNANINCSNIWMATDSLVKVIIEWLVGMSRESEEGLWLMWNQMDGSKMQYFSSADVNNSTLLNYAKKRSETLCRGIWITKNISSIEPENIKGNVVCIDFWSSGGTIDASMSKKVKDAKKTLIVKNGNVIVDPFVDPNDTSYYDMFINNGKLFINETSETKKFVFTSEGFLSDWSIDKFKSEFMSTMGSPEGYRNDKGVAVWSFIRGNFIVDWSVKGTDVFNNGKLNNKYFIYWKFTTKDTFKDLEDIFVWRCKDWFVVNKQWVVDHDQWTYCPPSIVSAKSENPNETRKYLWKNPYENYSLVVIDQNYDSPLYW